MKLLKFKINKCTECPCRYWNEQFEEYFCRIMELDEHLKDGIIFRDEIKDGFPKWCPLQDIGGSSND